MADEYIKKSDALNAMEWKWAGAAAFRAVSEIPSADVAPIKHGKWIEKEIFYDENADVISDWQSARCSVCNTYHTTPYSYYFTDYNFCPNCGADMRKDGE